MILHANCKINLGLDVLRRREDGYHELSTVMFPVRGLYDVVGVTRTAVPGVRFLSEGLAVDCAPGENICVKAFQLMRERYGVDGVEIRLDKRVPFGAGSGAVRPTAPPYCWRSTGFSACGLPRRSWSPLPPSWVATRLFSCAIPRSFAPGGARSWSLTRSAWRE